LHGEGEVSVRADVADDDVHIVGLQSGGIIHCGGGGFGGLLSLFIIVFPDL
jgi:hypothetical protein